MSGLQNYDAWLTTDRVAEEAGMRAEAEEAAWLEHCDEAELDPGAADPDHPDHEGVFLPWVEEWERGLESAEDPRFSETDALE